MDPGYEGATHPQTCYFQTRNQEYFWVNLITSSLRANPGNHGLFQGNHPQMAELFRLVNYYNLPRYLILTMYQSYQQS